MKAAKKASRKARQAEHHASQKLLRAAERGIQHAAAILAIDAAIVEAERPDQTVPQLITAHETLQQVGVGDGGWQSFVQHMPGYGLPLQEAIARMGACLARMRWRIATQATSAVATCWRLALLAAGGGGDMRETTEFKHLCEVSSVLQTLEDHSQLRGLVAGGLIVRDPCDASPDAATARLSYVHDGHAEQSSTAPSAEPTEEATSEAEQQPMQRGELTYAQVFGERLGPVHAAYGRVLKLLAQLDPWGFTTQSSCTCSLHRKSPCRRGAASAIFERAAAREVQVQLDWVPRVPWWSREWHPEVLTLLMDANARALPQPIDARCDSSFSFKELVVAFDQPEPGALIEPVRELLVRMSPVLPLLDQKGALRGGIAGDDDASPQKMAVALTNHLLLAMGSESSIALAVAEPYLPREFRSSGSWPQTFELLSAVLRANNKRLLVFTRRYAFDAWTFCIHYLSADGTSAMQLLLGAAMLSGGEVIPLPSATAKAFCAALGCRPQELQATANRAPSRLLFLDDSSLVSLSLRPCQFVYNEAALGQLWCAHKANATQGEQLRLQLSERGGVEPGEAAAAAVDTMPVRERAFESARYAQSLEFALTQASSAVRDVRAATMHRSLAPPPPYAWVSATLPTGLDEGQLAATLATAPYPPRDSIADPARNPAGPAAERYRELQVLRSPVTDPAAPSSEVTSAAGAASSAAAGAAGAASSAAAGAAEAAAVGARTSTRGAGRRVLARRPSPTAPKRARL